MQALILEFIAVSPTIIKIIVFNLFLDAHSPIEISLVSAKESLQAEQVVLSCIKSLIVIFTDSPPVEYVSFNFFTIKNEAKKKTRLFNFTDAPHSPHYGRWLTNHLHTGTQGNLPFHARRGEGIHACISAGGL